MILLISIRRVTTNSCFLSQKYQKIAIPYLTCSSGFHITTLFHSKIFPLFCGCLENVAIFLRMLATSPAQFDGVRTGRSDICVECGRGRFHRQLGHPLQEGPFGGRHALRLRQESRHQAGLGWRQGSLRDRALPLGHLWLHYSHAVCRR